MVGSYPVEINRRGGQHPDMLGSYPVEIDQKGGRHPDIPGLICYCMVCGMIGELAKLCAYGFKF